MNSLFNVQIIDEEGLIEVKYYNDTSTIIVVQRGLPMYSNLYRFFHKKKSINMEEVFTRAYNSPSLEEKVATSTSKILVVTSKEKNNRQILR